MILPSWKPAQNLHGNWTSDIYISPANHEANGGKLDES